MAIPVSKVYDTVIRLLNKEERGRVTPAAFNRSASLAQRTIFEKTFDEAATLRTGRRFDATKASAIREKISVHRNVGALTRVGTTNVFTLPADVYRLESIGYTGGTINREVTEIMSSKVNYIQNSDKDLISTTNPKYVRLAKSNGIDRVEIYPSSIADDLTVRYFGIPADPIYNTQMIAGVTQFNPTGSVDFALHDSEEFELIKKILYYSGVVVRENEIVQIAAGDQGTDYNIENK